MRISIAIVLLVMVTLLSFDFPLMQIRNRGELVGVRAEKFKIEKPFGMSFINGGAFSLSTADHGFDDLSHFSPRTVSVASFFMDETEITNGEYMQFVRWVRDSIARDLLGKRFQQLGTTDQSEGIGQFAFKNLVDDESLSEYQRYMIERYGEDFTGTNLINWDAPLTWDFNEYYDMDYAEVMDSLYIHPSRWINGVPKLDIKKFKYRYVASSNEAQDSQSSEPNSSLLNQQPFISEEIIEVYPDTTVWIKDFYYSYNVPMHNNYFWHPAYRDYPVVGVNWNQANAFCIWRTDYKNIYKLSNNEFEAQRFRLPTEIEWEYAAKGGVEPGIYPWGTNDLVDERNRFLANFKPERGDYTADYALYTVEAKSYKPNGYNLYNMAGNVSEWTNTSYIWNNADYIPTLNPNIKKKLDNRKVIKGGSWKDVAYFLQISSRDYEYADSAKSYIGFRTVQDATLIQ